jgi:flavin-dependent dehydrogenase
MPVYDVVIAGAGSAGCAAAYHLARRGLRVAVLERGALAAAGARWVNGVAPEMFDAAGLARPAGDELRGGGGPFILCDPTTGARVTVPVSPVWQVDMPRLVARLQALAASAGAHFFAHVRPLGLALEAGRPAALAATGGGVWRARLFVDATGVTGALRRMLPAFGGEALAPSDVCGAAQHVRRIADPAGARDFLARWGVARGANLAFAGLAGGYSTLVVQVDAALREVELLAGAAGPGGSGRRLLAAFVQRERWIGPLVFGGQGAIPLRRPWRRFAAPGMALVGDAACQVFPAHGSGVGAGLIAGRLLAEAAAARADAGGAGAMQAYQAAYRAGPGAVAAAYDVFRRLSQSLAGAEAARLVSAGLVSRGSLEAGLAQRMPAPGLGDGAAVARGAVRAPRLAARLAPALVHMGAAYALARVSAAHAAQQRPLDRAEKRQARRARRQGERHPGGADGRETEQVA